MEKLSFGCKKKPESGLAIYPTHCSGDGGLSALPMNLSIRRIDTTGRLIMDPVEFIAQVQRLETQALSPDPTLPRGAPFSWLRHI